MAPTVLLLKVRAPLLHSGARLASGAGAAAAPPPLLVAARNGVKTLTYNDPRRLNAWTAPLMRALRSELDAAAADDQTRAVVLAGADPYYCAGVDLGAMVSQPMWPSQLHVRLVAQNTALFDMFLSFPKPLFFAVNGPAIGAAVTSATLGEGIVASERATFATPFAALGLVPEGCSSVHFGRLMGAPTAARMLGAEGWRPTAAEALAAGLIDAVVAHEALGGAAQAMAEAWLADARPKRLVAAGLVDAYKAVNRAESRALADAFLSPRFFDAQAAMAAKKGKRGRAAFFTALTLTRPLWGGGLPAAGGGGGGRAE
jgi:enoyl-CoA hydratase/carnithine racemase